MDILTKREPRCHENLSQAFSTRQVDEIPAAVLSLNDTSEIYPPFSTPARMGIRTFDEVNLGTHPGLEVVGEGHAGRFSGLLGVPPRPSLYDTTTLLPTTHNNTTAPRHPRWSQPPPTC